MNFLLIVVGLVLLIFGGDWLLKSAVALSLKLKISKVVIGMTVVSFATSAPELIVSINAALTGSSDLALGNVIGSNVANLGLVLGITLLLGSMSVSKDFYKLNWPVMMIASLLLYVFLWNDSIIVWYEGLILFVFLVSFIVYLLRSQKNFDIDEVLEEEIFLPNHKTLFFFVIGGLGLWGGSELLIKGATSLALEFGVTERVIGVTLVSIGTSVPELAASIIAVLKKEKAISLGNLIGSNIFNILAVIGITSIITPVSLTDQRLLSSDIFWMLAISFSILPMVLLPKKFKLSWINGLLLLVAYCSFIYVTI
ncbi:calcium/sodium antiporter [Polaribacter dokdonensis]|uniref:Cation:H+ antiporter n=1 Tax=Polaribacter dokdonensis DSW-5 TaxID=1300348 RepID=A0A0M9CEW6_9FLAO|nr:calcium/sodium antiporter [Polaribacter dokdonensis]KOY51083.1 Sodium/potassium/calcium exchanger [Polaribacter dokdonensis DSW-5]SEE19131.1 cation:H+ antiporter [Polaribacter dokdonensis DSW-5]